MKKEFIEDVTNHFLRLSELVSESFKSKTETLKQVQGDGANKCLAFL